MRLLITALACLISVGVFGQTQYCSCSDFSVVGKGYCYSARSSGNTIEIAKENSSFSITNQIKQATGVTPQNSDLTIICAKLTQSTDGTYWSYKAVSFNPPLQKNSASDNNIRIRVSDNRPDISKVAVIGKESNLCDGSKDDGQSLAELVEGELLGIYGVVERKHLEEILDEQRLAMSGLLFEDSDFAQAGCLAGAQGTVLVSYGCLQGKTKLQIKLVDCSTSDLYWSATGIDVSAFEVLDALRIELSN
jgi:hypothetical protein